MPRKREFARLARLEAQISEDLIYTRHEHNDVVSEWKRKPKPLGKGGMGEVFCEQCVTGHDAGRLRAVKVVRKPNARLDYGRELEAIARFSQPEYQHCFVRSFGWYESIDSIFITMEYVEHGDLQKYVGHPMPESEMQLIASQILEGLAYLHSTGYAHRDLKPGNLLVFSEGPRWHVKLADFGLSKRVIEGFTSLCTRGGTLGYMAPELLGLGDDSDEDDSDDDDSKRSYTNAVDIWALGVISYVMLTGNLPFSAMDQRPIKRYVKGKAEFPETALLHIGLSTEGCAWIKGCMAVRPVDRPSAGFSRRHNWVMGAGGSTTADRILDRSAAMNETFMEASWTTKDSGYESTIRSQSSASPVRDDKIEIASLSLPIITAGQANEKEAEMPPLTAIRPSSEGRNSNTFDYSDCRRCGVKFTDTSRKHDCINCGNEFCASCSTKSLPLPHLGIMYPVLVDDGCYDELTEKISSPKFQPKPFQSNNSTTQSHQAGFRRLGNEICVTAVTISPDGTRVASKSKDRTIRLFDASTGSEIWHVAPAGHIDKGTLDKGLAFSPDGKLLASGLGDDIVRMWELTTGQEVKQFASRYKYTGIRNLAISPDGQRIASQSEDGGVNIWNIATGALIRQSGDMFNGFDRLGGFAFARDGMLVLPYQKYWLRADVPQDYSPRCIIAVSIKSYVYHGLSARSIPEVTLSPTLQHLAGMTNDHKVAIYDWNGDEGEPCESRSGSQILSAILFSPDGKLLASAWSDGAIEIWQVQKQKDRPSAKKLIELDDHGHKIAAVAFSADNQRIVSASEKGAIIVRDLSAMLEPQSKSSLPNSKQTPPTPTATLSGTRDAKTTPSSYRVKEVAKEGQWDDSGILIKCQSCGWNASVDVAGDLAYLRFCGFQITCATCWCHMFHSINSKRRCIWRCNVCLDKEFDKNDDMVSHVINTHKWNDYVDIWNGYSTGPGRPHVCGKPG